LHNNYFGTEQLEREDRRDRCFVNSTARRRSIRAASAVRMLQRDSPIHL